MKNRALLVLLVIVLVVSLAAFAACKAEEEAPQEEEGVWQWPEKFMFGVVGVETGTYAVAIGWMTPFAKDTGVTARVVVAPDMNVLIDWLKSGALDQTSVKQSGQPWIETNKELATRDGGPLQLRALSVGGKRDSGWATTPGSGIETPYDIKPGTRIIYPAYLGPVEDADSQMGLIAWAQVDKEDIVWVPCSSTSATARLLMDGKADVVHVEDATHSMWLEAEVSPRGLAFLDLDAKADPEGAARYRAKHLTVQFAIITDGCPASLGNYGMTSMGPYLVMDFTDPELTYHLTKWLNEKHDLYKDNHPLCAAMTIENVMTLAETHYIPFHEGVVRYLKELGVWTPAAEARLRYNIDLINSYIEAYQNAIDEADSKGIEVNPKNKEWEELWYSHRDPLPALHHGIVE